MSQLQIGLISLGALIILAVLMFNWWQERSIRREMLRRFEGPLDDVLMERDERQEDNDFTLGAAAEPDDTPRFSARVEEDIVVEIESLIEKEPPTQAPPIQASPRTETPVATTPAEPEPEYDQPAARKPRVGELRHDDDAEIASFTDHVRAETEAVPEIIPEIVPEAEHFHFAAERTQRDDFSGEVGAEFVEMTEAPDIDAAAEVIAEELEPEPVWISNPADAEAKPLELPPNVDPRIDDYAIVRPNRPATGAAIREALMPLPAFQKSVRWLGRMADGSYTVVTKEHEQTQFTHIVCAMQLADRSGPAHGEDLRNFHQKVEDLTARVGAGLEWHEHGDPLEYARQLDQFCIDVDVMISLQLAGGATGPFAGTKLRGVAEANGLTLQEDGRFHYLTEDGTSQFVMVSQDKRPFTPELLRTTMFTGLVLMMDIPRAANGVEVFNLMVTLGRKLETALATRLMDDNQQQLGEGEIDKIRQQLKFIYKKMLARGIVPGGPSALRLFS